MKSLIMSTMKSGADQYLQLSLSDTSHCITVLSVARIFSSFCQFEMKYPMMTVCLKMDYLATFQKEKKKETIHIFLKTRIGQRILLCPH